MAPLGPQDILADLGDGGPAPIHPDDGRRLAVRRLEYMPPSGLVDVWFGPRFVPYTLTPYTITPP